MTKNITIFKSPLVKNRIIAFLLPMVLLIISATLLQLASVKIETYQQNLTDFNLKTQTYQEAQSLNQYVNDNLTILEQMSVALPSESMMVSVVQDFESVIKNYDSNATIKLMGQTPVRVGQDLVIPVTVLTSSSSTQITAILSQLMDLPYITQLLTLESQINADNTQSVINLRIYVQDPFTGY